jgi:hypothetical protein
MADQTQKPKTARWLAYSVGAALIVFGLAMFVWILSWRGLVDASPYLVAVVGGAYISLLPRRKARAEAKTDAAGRH